MVISNNKEWGFFGTLKSNFGVSDSQAAKLFSTASQFFADSCDTPEEVAAMFLDSTYGRHFADSLTSHTYSRSAAAHSPEEKYVGGSSSAIRELQSALRKELTTNKRHLKEFQRFVREFQAEETSEFGESKFNKLVQRVLETKG